VTYLLFELGRPACGWSPARRAWWGREFCQRLRRLQGATVYALRPRRRSARDHRQRNSVCDDRGPVTSRYRKGVWPDRRTASQRRIHRRARD